MRRLALKAKGIAKKALASANVVDEYFVPRHGTRSLAPYLQAGNHVAVHHLIRYQWACRVLSDRSFSGRLLDIACGVGFGAHMLAETLADATVQGADYDPRAVSRARDLYQAPNLTFARGDMEQWNDTLGSARFDCIVSFDTLEHISHRDLALQGIVDHLSDDGVILLSTPSGGDRTNLRPDWEHHHIEYAADDLYDLLRRYFADVQRPDGEDPPPGLEVFDQLAGSGIAYKLRMNPLLCGRPLRIPNPYR
jgi:SAM-dependent methyltransferase